MWVVSNFKYIIQCYKNSLRVGYGKNNLIKRYVLNT